MRVSLQSLAWLQSKHFETLPGDALKPFAMHPAPRVGEAIGGKVRLARLQIDFGADPFRLCNAAGVVSPCGTSDIFHIRRRGRRAHGDARRSNVFTVGGRVPP